MRVFIDSWATGISDLTREQQADLAIVLRVMVDSKKFSCFEASDNAVIARTVTDLIKDNYVTTKDLGYPWTGVKITSKGAAFLLQNPVEKQIK